MILAIPEISGTGGSSGCRPIRMPVSSATGVTSSRKCFKFAHIWSSFFRGQITLALVVSYNKGLPVRVTRGLGSKHHTYRYDGLYLVERWWVDTGKSGFTIFKFALRKIDDKPISTPAGELPLPSRNHAPGQVETHTTRVVRDTLAAQVVKEIHHHQCQACQTTIKRPGGAYAEGAYIKPLGRPHNGPDSPDNILCLCPNCHVLFEGWAFSVEADGRLIGALSGELTEAELHPVNRDYLRYHRHLYRDARGHWQNPQR